MPVELQNSTFYHIPKTGGTWVSKLLVEEMGFTASHPEYRHPNGLDRQHATPKGYSTIKKSFCFVRHPVTWYQSYWRYKTKGLPAFRGQDWNPKETEIDGCKDLGFNNFVNKVMDRWPNGYLTMIYSQFIDDVDFIGRQEQLGLDLYEILNLCEETFDPQLLMEASKNMINISWNMGGDAVYCKSTIDRVLSAESEIIERFYHIYEGRNIQRS